MDRKKQLEALQTSSSEESGIDSSDADEFDSEDERVKQVPLHPQTFDPDAFTQEDEEGEGSFSDEEDSDSESVETTNKTTGQESNGVTTYMSSSDDDEEEEDEDEDNNESEDESEETQELNVNINTNTKTPTKTLGGNQAKQGASTVQDDSSVKIKGKVEDAHSVKKTLKTEDLNKQYSEKEGLKPKKTGKPENANGNVNKGEQSLKNVKPGNEEMGNRSTMKNGKSVGGNNEEQANRLASAKKDAQQKSEQRSGHIEKKEKDGKSANKDDKDIKANKGELGKRSREEELSDKEGMTNMATAQKKKKEQSTTDESLAKEVAVTIVPKKQQSVMDESLDKDNSKKKKNKKEHSNAPTDVKHSFQNGDKKTVQKEKTVNQESKKDNAKKMQRAESIVTGHGSSLVLDQKVLASKQESEAKQKRAPHVWKLEEEVYFLQQVLDHVKLGNEAPYKKNEEYWGMVLERMQNKFGVEFCHTQLYEKLRRFRNRYQTMESKVKEAQNANKPYQHKNTNDQVLYDLWDQIWGRSGAGSPDDRDQADVEQTSKSNGKGGHDAKDSKAKQVSKAKGSDDNKVVNKDPAKAKNSDNYKGEKNNPVKTKDTNNIDNNVPTEINKNASKNHLDEINTEMDVDKNEKASEMEIDKCGNAMDVDKSSSHDGSDTRNALVACNGQFKGNMNIMPESMYITLSVFDLKKIVQTEIQTSLNELQEQSMKSLDEWTSRATAQIEKLAKDLVNQNQARQVNCQGNGQTMSHLGGLDIRNVMDFQPLQDCDPALKQEWDELQLQELNIYSQRLKLMQRECELKKEKLKLQLQLDRGQKG